jgi:hypothetical protein
LYTRKSAYKNATSISLDLGASSLESLPLSSLSLIDVFYYVNFGKFEAPWLKESCEETLDIADGIYDGE